MKKETVKLEMPALSVNEGFARTFAAAFAARLDPTLEELADLKTVVSEAVTNAIVHAYPERAGSVVVTAAVVGDRTLEFTVRDRGRGIEDIGRAMTPMYTTGGEERSGLGFTIMESFTDSLRVTSKPGKGTCVRFRKRIAPRM